MGFQYGLQGAVCLRTGLLSERNKSCGGASHQGQLKALRGGHIVLDRVKVDLLGHGHSCSRDHGVDVCLKHITRTEHT